MQRWYGGSNEGGNPKKIFLIDPEQNLAKCPWELQQVIYWFIKL